LHDRRRRRPHRVLELRGGGALQLRRARARQLQLVELFLQLRSEQQLEQFEQPGQFEQQQLA
jgi:hypothetical protein